MKEAVKSLSPFPYLFLLTQKILQKIEINLIEEKNL